MNKSVGFGLLLILVVGIAGAGYYLTQGLDGFVKAMIEQIGTDTTKTPVTVRDVNISLTEGSGRLGGLTVANPEGFTPGNLFTMEDIAIAIDTASLTRDVYVVKEISVDGASILFEQLGTNTNLQTLMKNMSTESSEAATSGESAATSETKLAINEVNFTNGTVLLKSDVLGERTLTLPDIALRDIGSAEQGLSPDAVGQAVAIRLTQQVRDAVSKELKEIAREEANRKLKEKLGDATSEGLNKLKGLFGKKDSTDDGDGG
jgi:hypothetical protein